MTAETYNNAKYSATHRAKRKITPPTDENGKILRVHEYFGENVFDVRKAHGIPENVRKEIIEVSQTGKKLDIKHAEIVAAAVTEWATGKGATHFCHWFHPLTGATAEKHDSFIDMNSDYEPIEKLSVSQLLQGEPDASSFPHGGARSTFEARGYTSWDLTSPMFLTEGVNGKVLCIPSAFVSYYGDALDVKTPLLRSISALNKAATRYMNLTGKKEVTNVSVTCGPEQEYFLVDKSFFYSRPDLVMTDRTLFGTMTARNQQLSDHYFGTVPERVLAFMQELDQELYRLGIPSKTRHNEVAPGQFEVAPIFTDANLASDQNQIVMMMVKKIATKHDFVAIMHEKPFAGINGSGKHLNWSMSDSTGENLLNPGKEPHHNYRFLTTVAIITEAVYRHADALRVSSATHGNDHRLGGHEAPPCIISIFLGSTLSKIYEHILSGKSFRPENIENLDLGATQIASLLQDNTDRNRTSAFAFTGNRFEFRAVGSSQAIGFPLTILNAAVTEVMEETNNYIEKTLKEGNTLEEAYVALIRKLMKNSQNVVFNGDGYSEDWVKEAETKRGLPNLTSTYHAVQVLKDKKATAFLVNTGVMRESELITRYNVLNEKYNLHVKIEASCLISMVNQSIIPAALEYKHKLGTIIGHERGIGRNKSSAVKKLYSKLTETIDSLYDAVNDCEEYLSLLDSDCELTSKKVIENLIPKKRKVAQYCNELETMIPGKTWGLPTYFDMLFLR